MRRSPRITFKLNERVMTEFGIGTIDKIQDNRQRSFSQGFRYLVKLDNKNGKIDPWLTTGRIQKIKENKE